MINFILMAALALTAFSATAAPTIALASHVEGRALTSRQVSINTKRMITIVDAITGDLVGPAVQRVDTLLKEGTAPIYLYINSPGGSVAAGYYFINSMQKAQGLGVKFICVVDDMAASMAFQILSHCDSRYSMKSSMLLWHPVRVNLFLATLTPSQATELANSLSYIEGVMLPQLQRTLGIDDVQFYEHYYAETLHYGSSLAQISPNFLTVVDTISNLVQVRQIALYQQSQAPKSVVRSSNSKLYEITYEYTKESIR